MFETLPRYEPTTHKIQTRFSTQKGRHKKEDRRRSDDWVIS